jgi:hypothetical protein
MRRVAVFALFVVLGVLASAPAGADVIAYRTDPAEVPLAEFGRGAVAITMKSIAASAQRRVVVRQDRDEAAVRAVARRARRLRALRPGISPERHVPAEDRGLSGFDHNVVAMMNVDTWDIQNAAVRAVLDIDPRATLVRSIDPETKLAAVRARYPDRFPNMAARHLVVSFEIWVAPGTYAGIVDELESLAGVDDVVSSVGGCDALAAHEVNPH